MCISLFLSHMRGVAAMQATKLNGGVFAIISGERANSAEIDEKPCIRGDMMIEYKKGLFLFSSLKTKRKKGLFLFSSLKTKRKSRYRHSLRSGAAQKIGQ